MKFGLVFSLWLLWSPLFSQDCEEIAIGPVHYYEGADADSREIESYFIPCSETVLLTFSSPQVPTEYTDPQPSTPAGIILVLLLRNPGQSLLSASDFMDLMYTDEDGQPIYFNSPEQAIQVTDLLNIGNTMNQYVLIPVLVGNAGGVDPESWFEEECVRIYPEKGLTLIEEPAEKYEFLHFDEITFSHWPEDIPISDFFDLTFTDQETGEEIPYTPTDNRSFRLKFSKSRGIFRFEFSWKNHECNVLEIGVNWTFPTVGISMDTVTGFRNIEKCVPVRAFNFESVTSFEFALVWDADSLDFTAIKSIHPALEPFLRIGDIVSTSEKNKIIIELPSDSDPVTLPDSAILFEWCGKPLAGAGEYVKMNFSEEGNDPPPQFYIQGLKTTHGTIPGGIIVQEDRELIYDLIQLCNTRDGRHRIELDIINDEAYPYFYSFHSPDIPDSTIRTVPFTIPDVPPGQYEFTIRDSFGFEITESFIVKESVPPGFDLTVDPMQVLPPTCLNPFGGQIGIRIDPSDQMYRLEMINDEAEFVGQTVSGLVAGTYVIEAENESGCIDTIHYTLQNPKEINVSWDAEDLVMCPDDPSVVLKIEDDSPVPDNSIEYQVDGGEIKSLGDTLILHQPGQYPFQVWNDDGCILDTSFVVRSGPQEIVIWDTGSVVILSGDTLNFSGPEPDGLSTTFWDYSGLALGEKIDVRFVPEKSGVLFYTATVYDKCHYSDSLMVQVIVPDQGPLEFEFPNVFSPNGDGINDYYAIRPTREIQQVRRMEIFDRYGNFIFEKDYSREATDLPGWDGKRAGVEVPAGVYAVQVELLLSDGRKETVNFDVTLLR